MRIARVSASDGCLYLARIDDSDVVTPISSQAHRPGSDPLREALSNGTDLSLSPPVADVGPLEAFELLAPVAAPQKILAIGLNYADHCRETGVDPPEHPVLFVKTPNSLIGPGEEIVYSTADSTQVDFEVELAIVVGERGRNIPIGRALDYVLGYTICNDVSARDAQFGDGQWTRGKSFDTFCPLGPWIVTKDSIPDPQNLALKGSVNGQTLQDSTTAEMIFTCAEIITYLSRVMTLEPGDVIATGTPYGVGFVRTPPVYLKDADEVTCYIQDIGSLTNAVRVS